ncbi:MAG: MBL fold metallo-hydrolase [bacterium]|nr:MBL fold metallo-hydrolase [bacterium]
MKKVVYVAAIILIAGNIFVWRAVAFGPRYKDLELDFLKVGQGDSELVILPGNVKILIDGGPDATVLNSLAKVLGPLDRRIDIVVNTHPQLDHFGGLIDVLKNYSVGAVIGNGRDGTIPAYFDFKKAVAASGAKDIILAEGDKIRYGEAVFDFLGPSKKNLTSKELNDTILVMLLKYGSLAALYTGDAGQDIEDELIKKYDLSAQVLKVGHHGSKFSSSPEFLKAVRPLISVIEVGKNTYGHPTKQALGGLANIGSQIYRTDQDGTVKIISDGKTLKVFD